MGRPLQLEEFSGGALSPVSTNPAPAKMNEEQRLEAFEQGYKAGWDDASNTLSEEQGQLTTDLAENLRELAFTYHEARVHVLKGVEPLIRQIVGSVLPEIAENALPDLILETINDLAKTAADAPVILTVAPGAKDRVEALIPADPGFPIEVREEPTLADGQALLRAGQNEQAIDVSSAVVRINSIVDDFFNLNDEAMVANG